MIKRKTHKIFAYILVAAMLLNTLAPTAIFAAPAYDESYMQQQAEKLRAELTTDPYDEYIDPETGEIYKNTPKRSDIDAFNFSAPSEVYDETASAPYPVSPGSEQQNIILQQHERRLIKVQAYLSSPTIPWEPWQFAGLRLQNTKANKNDVVEVSSRPENAWTKILDREREYREAKIYAAINSGTVINALLISGLNSDLPGHVVAQVSEHVYDSPTGKRLLIPQGSRLFGDYDSKVLFGQKRALIKWTRLIYPDASVLDLQNMPGADRKGMAGFKGSVDNHFGPMLGSAALVSLFAGLADSFDDNGQSIVLNNPNITLPESVPVGTIVAWHSPVAPEGWLLCDGKKFDVAEFPELEQVLSSDKTPNYIEDATADIGTIAAIPGIVAPSGYLALDGSNFDVKKYPELASYLGTNQLPDYRGVFLRGANNGRSDGKGDTQAWRTLGSYQADSFGRHTHAATGATTVSGAFEATGTTTASGYANLSGVNTMTGYGSMSGHNTMSGSNIMTGSNMMSGSNTMTGNNTMTGYNSMTGYNTMSGNNTMTGSNTLTGTASVSGTTNAVNTSRVGGNQTVNSIRTGRHSVRNHGSYWFHWDSFQDASNLFRIRLHDTEAASERTVTYLLTSPITVAGAGTTSPHTHSVTGTGTANVTGEINVAGTTTVRGTTDVSGSTEVSGTTSVSGMTIVSGDTLVSGTTNVAGTVNVSGAVNVSGTTDVSGPISVTGPVTVKGIGNFQGYTTVSNDITGDEETRPRNIAVMWGIKATNHIDKKYWIIRAESSGIGAGGTSISVKNGNGSEVAKELADTLSKMADKLLQKYLDLAPTLTVQPGYRFSVIVNKEIALPVKAIRGL